MLVINRRKKEWVRVGEDILLTIMRIAGTRVRIGILAPQDVRVLRTELLAQNVAPREGGTGGLLVLSRLQGESIRLGEDVTVTVTQVRRKRVQLGFEAPRSIPIHRVPEAVGV